MDSPEERKDENHFELRRQYRESALTLSSACDSSVGWAASQSLLDTFWDDQEVLSGQPISQPTLYACQRCGFVLHPGFLGTTVRVRNKKSEVNRSRRRREQRRKRKAAIAKQKQKRDSNIPRSIASLQKGGTTLVIMEDDPFVVCDRHHLVITCGRCRFSVRCKGLKREVLKSKSFSTTGSASTSAQMKETAPELKSASEFVALPPVSTKLANPVMPTGQRKKKKKQKTPPKSNLMNFLNSLND